jgi:tRNA(fMet)-specific endonuclease VapC
MKIALDGNRYTDFWNGLAAAVQTIEQADAIYLPFAVVAELRSGFLNGSRAAENERTLHSFLNSPDVSILFPDQQTTLQYAAIHHHLRMNGTPIPVNDVWIAALAIQHGLHLYARDRHFDCVPQLLRI